MAVLRIEVLKILAECIANKVPALRNRICAGPAESPKKLGFPSLAIIPVRFRYFPDQASEYRDPGPGRACMNVGRHEGTVQLRLGAQTHIRRSALEDAILDVFLEREGAPGVLVTAIPNVLDATVAWELDTDEWENERAFDKKWYSILTVMAQLPALVTRGSAHTMEEIRLTLTEDLTTPIEQLPAGDQETVLIGADGSITPAAGP